MPISSVGTRSFSERERSSKKASYLILVACDFQDVMLTIDRDGHRLDGYSSSMSLHPSLDVEKYHPRGVSPLPISLLWSLRSISVSLQAQSIGVGSSPAVCQSPLPGDQMGYCSKSMCVYVSGQIMDYFKDNYAWNFLHGCEVRLSHSRVKGDILAYVAGSPYAGWGF
jgi:hypothetical protein